MSNPPTPSARTFSKLTCVMSLTTGTNRFTLNRESLMLTTLAILRNKEVFKKLIFFADDYAYEIGTYLGWPVEYGYLREIEDPEIWALNKFHAILGVKEPCAHVDNDAMFIHNEGLHRLERAALFAQGIDKPEYYESKDMQLALAICGFQEGLPALNCGIMGGSNVELLHLYCRNSIELARRFRDSGINGTTASMAIEQYHLARFAEATESFVSRLLPRNPTLQQIDRAGWIHLHGKAKHDVMNINRVEQRLIRDYPGEWEKFNEGWDLLVRHAGLIKVAA